MCAENVHRVLHDRLLFAGGAKITIGGFSWKNFPECESGMLA
jgi:hypothetical protein